MNKGWAMDSSITSKAENVGRRPTFLAKRNNRKQVEKFTAVSSQSVSPSEA